MYLFKCLIFFCLSQLFGATMAWSWGRVKSTTETAPMYSHERSELLPPEKMFGMFSTTMLPLSTTYKSTESTTEDVSKFMGPDFPESSEDEKSSTTEFISSEISTTVPTTISTTKRIPTSTTTTPATTSDTTDESYTNTGSTSTTIFPTVSSAVTDSTTTDSSTIFSSTTTEGPSETFASTVPQSFPGNGPRAINGSNSDSGYNDPTNDSETTNVNEFPSETPLQSSEASNFTVTIVNNIDKTSTTESTVNPEDEDAVTNRNKHERNVVSTTTRDPSLDSNKNRNSTMEDTTTEVTTPMISLGSISETGEKQVKSSSFNSIGSNKFLSNLLSLLITLYIFC